MSSRGTVGFKDRGRALELPAGRDLTGESGRSPVGRARLRYNAVANQLEASLSGATYEALTTSGGGGGGTVEDITTLSALDDTTYDDGTNVAVASVRDLFELDKSSTLAVDGITVAATLSGTGRWVRKELPSGVWAEQATWFIDPVGGGDENDGSTSGKALASWAEWVRRVGDLEVAQATTITVLSNLAEGRYLVRGRHPGGLFIEAAETVVDSGTFTAVTAWDTTTTPVVVGTCADTSQDFSAHVGKLLRVTTGAAAGAAAWILKANPTGGGNTTARVGQWFNLGSFATTAPAIGDDYEIVDQVEMDGIIESVTGDSPNNGFVLFRRLAVGPSGSDQFSPVVGANGNTVFQECAVRQGPTGHAASYQGYLNLIASLVDGGRLLFEGGHTTGFLTASSWLDAELQVSQGAHLSCFSNNAYQRVGGGSNASRTALTLRRGGSMATQLGATAGGSSWGACDLGASGQAAIRVDPGCEAAVQTNGRIWTLDQGLGTWGVRVQPLGLLSWPVGTNAPAALNFDTLAGGSEVDLGGATTDAATLAAAGSVTAANNATAVPRTI